MREYQKAFIEFAIAQRVLRFGEFTLKSGRVSPYFFNAGLFDNGATVASLGEFFADRLLDWGQSFDVLFGPAYKGIPLATATAMALSRKTGEQVPFCFNRKEIKDHGEGGMTVGAPLQGRVVIIDDVITAGISVAESTDLIRREGAEPAAVCIALDRLERDRDNNQAASQQIEAQLGIPVLSIADLNVLTTYLEEQEGCEKELESIASYRRQYGASTGQDPLVSPATV